MRIETKSGFVHEGKNVCVSCAARATEYTGKNWMHTPITWYARDHKDGLRCDVCVDAIFYPQPGVDYGMLVLYVCLAAMGLLLIGTIILTVVGVLAGTIALI